MFDAAGELFYSTERTQELGFLGKARTFILVIDPLSVAAFWDRLLPEQQAELEAARSAAPSPELAYQQTHQEIEAMGVQLRKARLAVVFSRADLIDDPAGGHGRLGPRRTRPRQPGPLGPAEFQGSVLLPHGRGDDRRGHARIHSGPDALGARA